MFIIPNSAAGLATTKRYSPQTPSTRPPKPNRCDVTLAALWFER